MKLLGNKRKNSYSVGVSVLAVSSVIVKFLGFLCKIPLLEKLGGEGMGYYNSAYEIYVLLCVMSVSGLPIAISLLSAGGTYSESVYKTALRVFLPLGVVGSLLLFFAAAPISALLDNRGAEGCIRAFAPAMLFISVSGILRGYFQGIGNMVPTAVSQIIESAGKFIFGITFAGIALYRGHSLAAVSAAAVYGIAAGAFMSALFLIIVKINTRRMNNRPALPNCAAQLIKTAIPITCTIAAVSLSRIIDTAMILRGLRNGGFDAEQASFIFGCYSTVAVPVFSIVPSLISAVSLPLIPCAADLNLRGDRLEFKSILSSAFGITLVFSIPSAFAFYLMPRELLNLIFSKSPEAVEVAWTALKLMGISLVPSCLINVTGAVIQALGYPGRAFSNTLAGIGIKICLEYFLTVRGGRGINGAVVSTVICDVAILLLNIAFISVKAGYFINIKPVLKPIAASSAAFMTLLLPFPNGKYFIILKIITICLTYFAICIMLGAIPAQFIPKGILKKWTEIKKSTALSKKSSTDSTTL